MPRDEPASEALPAAGLRVLVVDDDEVDRLAVKRCWRQCDLRGSIDEATTGEDAAALVKPGAYDCVLLDFHLPGADTIELLRRLRASAEDTPVIVCTGRGDEELAVALMKAGAADYLPKSSLTPERLAASLRHAVELSRAAAARRRAEEQLREREAEFRTMANVIPQLAWIADREGRRYWYNARWYEFTGLRPDQCLGLGWTLVLHPDHRSRVYEGQLAAFAGDADRWEDTVLLRRADGEYRSFLSCAMPIKDDRGRTTRWFGTNTDISERLEAQRALAASEERFRRALEIETVGIIFFTTGGEITLANDAFLRMGGYAREDVRAGRVRWDQLTPPEFMPASRRAVEEFESTGRTTPYEKQYIRKDGSRWWALFAATRLNEREGVEFVLDISAQKDAQLARERSLASEQAARVAAEEATRLRDEVLEVLAHDLRNPMTSIRCATTVLRHPAGEEMRGKYLGAIDKATRAMEALLGDLLDFARIEAGTMAIRREPVDVGRVLREAVDLFEPQALPRETTLEVEVEDGLPSVAGDRDRLLQVLANLLGNALKFSGTGTTITARAARRGDGGVEVSVRDRGIGIRPEHIERIFDRFWQADRTGRAGAGLGLAICKAIVEAHDGRIWAESALGEGTTVRFEIPRERRPPGEAAAAPSVEAAAPAPCVEDAAGPSLEASAAPPVEAARP